MDRLLNVMTGLSALLILLVLVSTSTATHTYILLLAPMAVLPSVFA